MSFAPMKLKPEPGANRIRSADDAYSFLAHLRVAYQTKAHWQEARQALDNVCVSDASVSTTCACQTRAKSGLGKPFGRRRLRKAGSWNKHRSLYEKEDHKRRHHNKDSSHQIVHQD
jgi:hypothetical protein